MKIAIISPGDRTDKITIPLKAVNADYTINPRYTRAYDVVICDTPDRCMFKEVVKHRFTDSTVIYRMRGNPFWGIDEWINSKTKQYLSLKMLDYVDGCIPISDFQADEYKDKTGVETSCVKLPKIVNNWPNTNHKSEELKIVTLTNATYWNKVKPLTDIFEVVNSVLETTGGYWKIGSWSEGYSSRLKNQISNYRYIEYHNKLDAKDVLANANVLIHYSNFDVFPNAILEGMASQLPVITNDYIAFKERNAPHIVCSSNVELENELYRLTEPMIRRQYGLNGENYVFQNHSPGKIGEDYLAAIQKFRY